MSTPSHGQSSLYLFERFEVGVIHLDDDRQVLAMNDFARQILPVDAKRPFGQIVTQFHPERSRPKVDFLLNQAEHKAPVHAAPMAMIINIPEQVLLIKVSRLANEAGKTTGYVLVFYDVTQVVSQPGAGEHEPNATMQLQRIPTVLDGRVQFVELDDILFLESQAHSTRLMTRQGWRECNLSIGDLQQRLDPERFMRVHRCFMVQIPAVASLRRHGVKTLVAFRHPHAPEVPVARQTVVPLKRALGL